GVEPPTFRFSGGRSYRLSYLTEAVLTGLEPATSTLTGWRALRLLYRTMRIAWEGPSAPSPDRAYHRSDGACGIPSGGTDRPRRGGGGPVFPARARSPGIVTPSPEALRTVKDSGSAASRMPSTSAPSSPPPAAGRRQRITTRQPTSDGPSRTSMRYLTDLP